MTILQRHGGRLLFLMGVALGVYGLLAARDIALVTGAVLVAVGVVLDLVSPPASRRSYDPMQDPVDLEISGQARLVMEEIEARVRRDMEQRMAPVRRDIEQRMARARRDMDERMAERFRRAEDN